MENIITAHNIYQCFRTGDGEDFFALKGVNMDVRKGALTILKGRSGSGKTTLMNILSTLDAPSAKRPEGVENIPTEIRFNDREYSSFTDKDKEMLRRKEIGFIFQAVALIPIMNAYENVDFALRLSEYGSDADNPELVRDKRIKDMLSLVGLRERMLHMPGQMSGGEQQRIAIARAVANEPAVIFADEPTGALDTESGLRVMRLFKSLIEKEGITIVMTTHDPGMMELGDIIYEMEDGELSDKWENN